MPKITPFLWFDDSAEQAMNHYVSIFKNSQVGTITREGGPQSTGRVFTVTFSLEGQEFIALNGGPHFKFTEAISLYVNCETQEEIDELWSKLSVDGRGQCGWLKDKFGLSWQLVPSGFQRLLQDPDPAKSGRVMAAMMKMEKLDIAALERAHAGQ